MRIRTKILFEFLKNVTINKKINTLTFDFNEKGLEIIDPYFGFVMVNGFLDKKYFVEYENIGKITISRLDRFVKILESNFKSKEIELIFKSKNNLYYELEIEFNKSILTTTLICND